MSFFVVVVVVLNRIDQTGFAKCKPDRGYDEMFQYLILNRRVILGTIRQRQITK